jgi:peptidoglycan hydrolase-like protein with peptidoglycan-binding domain
MAMSLTWLADALRNAGLKVAEVDGWKDRGRGDVGEILGVVCHDTAGPITGNMPSLHTLINGRPDLAGPLSQLGLGRDGTFYVIAAGRCNHAGAGTWEGSSKGNTNFIGIEAENTGGANDFPWPDVQMDAYARGVAAILKHIGKGADACAGHKEYATPHGRKQDPSFDMDLFRKSITAILSGNAPPPNIIPAAEPASPAGAPGRPTLRRGANNDLVKVVQSKVGVAQDGDFGAKTEAAVREFQRKHGLAPDGIVGPKTWAAIDAAP